MFCHGFCFFDALMCLVQKQSPLMTIKNKSSIGIGIDWLTPIIQLSLSEAYQNI